MPVIVKFTLPVVMIAIVLFLQLYSLETQEWVKVIYYHVLLVMSSIWSPSQQ